MTGQQLDLFGGPLRPPKKILEDEQPVEKLPAEAPAQKEEIITEIPDKEPITPEEIPASSIAENDTEENTISEDEIISDEEMISEEEEEMILAEEVSAEMETVQDLSALTEEEEPVTEIEAEALREIEEEEEAIINEAEEEAIEPAEEVMAGEPLASVTETAAKEENIDQPEALEEEAKSNGAAKPAVVFRGRKSADPEEEMEMLNVPPDEDLFKRQYYSMRETAAMFNVNQSLLRFWENEFDILQPKKNKKGDRYFRPIDVKNLVLVYHLLRVRKFTMEGAKEYLNTHQKAGDSFQLIQRLEKLKSFLLELKANL